MNLYEKLKYLDENPDDVLELNQEDITTIQQIQSHNEEDEND